VQRDGIAVAVHKLCMAERAGGSIGARWHLRCGVIGHGEGQGRVKRGRLEIWACGRGKGKGIPCDLAGDLGCELARGGKERWRGWR
jgi:hypothetical protein